MFNSILIIIVMSAAIIGSLIAVNATQKKHQQIKYGTLHTNNSTSDPQYHVRNLSQISNHQASLDHLIYEHYHRPDPNQYIYYYFKRNGNIQTETTFPKPATKTLKVTQWKKHIRAVDVAMKMYDPNYDPAHSLKQDPTMFQIVYEQYLKAYVQSFSNYQQYQIDIAVQKTNVNNIDLGVYDYLTTITFQSLPQGGH